MKTDAKLLAPLVKMGVVIFFIFIKKKERIRRKGRRG